MQAGLKIRRGCPLFEVEIEDKRDSRRVACELETRGTVLSPVESDEQPQLVLEGTTDNISRGGICLSTDEFVPVDSVVRCEFALPENTSVIIPSLLKVRWFEKPEGTNQYKLGLQFLV